MTALKTKLEATKAKLEAQNFAGLAKDDISLLIHNYAFEEGTQAYKERTLISTLGWRIVKKFGWDKHLNKPETIKILMEKKGSNWQKKENPFIDLIWDDVQKKR